MPYEIFLHRGGDHKQQKSEKNTIFRKKEKKEISGIVDIAPVNMKTI